MRTVLSEVTPALAAPLASQLQRNLKSIADELGAVRDADVRCAILLPMLRSMSGPAVTDARTALQAERHQARLRMQTQLHSASLQQCLQTLDRLIADRALFGPNPGRADELLIEALRRRRKKVEHGLGKDCRKPSRLHALRIRVKKFRYLLDASDGQTKAHGDKMSALLHDLQDCLGQLNDLVQTRRWLKERPLKPAVSKALKIEIRAGEKRAKSRLERLRRKFRRLRTDTE